LSEDVASWANVSQSSKAGCDRFLRPAARGQVTAEALLGPLPFDLVSQSVSPNREKPCLEMRGIPKIVD